MSMRLGLNDVRNKTNIKPKLQLASRMGIALSDELSFVNLLSVSNKEKSISLRFIKRAKEGEVIKEWTRSVVHCREAREENE